MLFTWTVLPRACGIIFYAITCNGKSAYNNHSHTHSIINLLLINGLKFESYIKILSYVSTILCLTLIQKLIILHNCTLKTSWWKLIFLLYISWNSFFCNVYKNRQMGTPQHFRFLLLKYSSTIYKDQSCSLFFHLMNRMWIIWVDILYYHIGIWYKIHWQLFSKNKLSQGEKWNLCNSTMNFL